MGKNYSLLFIAFCLFFVTNLHGQLKIGIGVGGQAISMWRISGDLIPDASSSKPLLYVGASISHSLSQKVSLSIEGDFVSGNYFTNIKSKQSRNWQELHYSLIHTAAVFRYKIGKKWSIGTGVLLSYIGPTNSRIKQYPLAEDPFVQESKFNSSIGYGIPISFGYQFKRNLFFDLQWNYGFKSRDRTVYGRLQTLSLGLAYQFELNKL